MYHVWEEGLFELQHFEANSSKSMLFIGTRLMKVTRPLKSEVSAFVLQVTVLSMFQLLNQKQVSLSLSTLASRTTP
ncbi:hypothetical protein ACFX12_042301 [Malus domestica]